MLFRSLEAQHVSCIEKLLETNPLGALAIMKQLEPRVYKKDYLLNALARFCVAGEQRKEAYELVLTACKTPTHLFHFIEKYEAACKVASNSTGWNRLQKDSVCAWYMDKPVLQLAYLVTKYKNRNGWTHTDVLRLAHPCAKDSLHDFLFAYVVKGYQAFQEKLQGLQGSYQLIEYITAIEALMASKSPDEAAVFIEQYNLAREHVPTALLNEPEIWRALSKKMPMVALMRNLNKMTSVGVFSSYSHDIKTHVIAQLTSEIAIQRSGVHPLQALIALNTYSKGKGEKGSLSWEPVPEIEASLETAFKLAFNNVEPTHKRIMYALDVSGSMTHASVCGIETMTASQVAVAMSMVLAAKEPNHVVMGFADKFKDLCISPDYSLKDSIHRVYMNTFGNTDISLPFTWALEKDRLFDVFVVFTDNETNCSKVRPADALRDYRKKTGINAKLVVVGLSANKITVADPQDPGMMDIAGFDPDVPAIIRDFVLS